MNESMLGFRFATYNDIKNIVNSSDLVNYTFIGIQVFACTFIILRLINDFVKDVYGGNKMNNVLQSLGLIVFISIAPYALDGIENSFAFLDDKISNFQIHAIPPAIKDTLIEIEMMQDDSWYQSMVNVGSLIVLSLLVIVGFLAYAIDSAVYAIFILERLIMIEFYRFVFPLFIAFISIDDLRNKYWTWVTGFLGLMLLPIPYMAIYHITLALQNKLFEINRSNPNEPSLLFDLLMTLIILIMTLGLKYKLLTSVTQKVTKLF